MTIAPLRGWLLEAVAELDSHFSGVAGHAIRASSERRQVIAALLSRTAPSDFSSELGEFLTLASHDCLLRRAFNRSIPGLRSALSRTEHVQPPRFYGYLAGILVAPSRQSSAKIVLRLARISAKRLAILRVLPHDLRLTPLIDCIKDVQQARDIAAVVEKFSANGLSREAMARALRSVSTTTRLTDFMRRWSLKLSLPDHPIPASQQYRPIVSGKHLADTALRYRNCMRRYLTSALDRKSAFAEFVHDEEAAVVHLVYRGEHWWFDEVYGLGNGLLGSAARESLMRYLAHRGVTSREYRGPSGSPWIALRRLSNEYGYDADD